MQTQIQGNFRCKRMLLHCWLIEYWMLIRDLWRFRIYNLGTLESEVSSEVSRGRMGTQGRFFNFIEMYNWLICDKLCQYFEVKHFSTYNMAFVFNPLVIAYIYIFISSRMSQESQIKFLEAAFGWPKTPEGFARIVWQRTIPYGCWTENSGFSPPKSSILVGFSIIFTIHFWVPLFLETPICWASLNWKSAGNPMAKRLLWELCSKISVLPMWQDGRAIDELLIKCTPPALQNLYAQNTQKQLLHCKCRF